MSQQTAQKSASEILYDKLKVDLSTLATGDGVATHMIIINTQLAEILARLTAIEENLADKKKTVKAPKDTTAAATNTSTAKASPKLPLNARGYFLNQYKAEEAYRAKHLTPDMQKVVDADDACSKKEKGTPGRYTAEAAAIWKAYTSTNKALAEVVKKEYEDLKSAAQATNAEPKVATETIDDL